MQVDVVRGSEGVGGIEADSVGTVGVGSLVGVGGFSGKIPGGDFGGKGVESKRQHGGKVWRFEAVGRNGGLGVDSSEEKLGLEDIVGNEVGGDVELEERSRVGTEECCGLQGSCCGGLKGSFCGGLSMENKPHLQIFLDTILDVRRMYDSMYIYKSSHALPQNVVD